MSDNINDQLVLIAGESGTGKSTSLMNLPDHERVIYLNCEAGKRLPFRNKFNSLTVTDPYQIHATFDFAQGNEDFDTIVIDTLTYMFDMFETQHVLTASNTMQAWSNFGQFFKILMQDKVANSDKAVICLAHTRSDMDEKSMEMKTSVPVKGALKNNGIESYFSTVVSTKKMSLRDLEGYSSDLLNITEQDELLGYKHVFQTQPTRQTIGERIRSPIGLFTQQETYMDNDAALLLQRLQDYYS